MVKWQKYASNSTIQPTAEVTWPFGTDKSVPYEHTGRGSIHPTFVNQVKDNIADESRYAYKIISAAQVGLADLVGLGQLRAGAGEGDLVGFQDVCPVGDGQGGLGILLHQ